MSDKRAYMLLMQHSSPVHAPRTIMGFFECDFDLGEHG